MQVYGTSLRNNEWLTCLVLTMWQILRIIRSVNLVSPLAELVGLEAPTFTEGNSSTLHSSQDRGKVDQAKVKPNIYIT